MADLEAFHRYVNPETDLGNPNETGPDEWNDGHDVKMTGPALAGRIAASLGNAHEISLGTGLAFGASDVHVDTTVIATKSYVDGLIAAADALTFKGDIDASGNPNYPAANAGDVYKISVAGKIGGASGPNVEVGDTIICKVDASASGNHATVGSNWIILQANIDISIDGTLAANSDGLVPSQKAVKTYADTKLPEPSGNGIAVKTGAGASTNRTIQGTANQISVSNGDGVAGDPTISATIASQAEAEAGTDTTKLMTAQRVAQAIAALGSSGFPSGTRTDFQQTSAPTGWTKETGSAYNDASPRVITGAVGTGGSVAFSTLFARTATDSYTLTSPADIPAHKHPAPASGTVIASNAVPAGSGPTVAKGNATSPISSPVSVTVNIGNTGSGGGHSHGMDMRVKFVDFIIAQKD